MNGLNIFRIGREDAEEAEPFLCPEMAGALKKGEPVLALGAAVDDKVAGALAGVTDGDVFEIFSLYVAKEVRREGIGRELIKKLEEVLEEDGIRNILISAGFSEPEDREGDLTAFFDALGFEEEESSYPSYFMAHIRDIVFKSGGMKDQDVHVIPFSDVNESLLEDIGNRAQNEGRLLLSGGLLSEKIDRDMSFCLVKGKELLAYSAAEVADDGIVRLPSIYAVFNDPESLIEMLKIQVDSLRKLYKDNIYIAYAIQTERVHSIFKGIVPTAAAVSRRFVK